MYFSSIKETLLQLVYWIGWWLHFKVDGKDFSNHLSWWSVLSTSTIPQHAWTPISSFSFLFQNVKDHVAFVITVPTALAIFLAVFVLVCIESIFKKLLRVFSLVIWACLVAMGYLFMFSGGIVCPWDQVRARDVLKWLKCFWQEHVVVWKIISQVDSFILFQEEMTQQNKGGSKVATVSISSRGPMTGILLKAAAIYEARPVPVSGLIQITPQILSPSSSYRKYIEPRQEIGVPPPQPLHPRWFHNNGCDGTCRKDGELKSPPCFVFTVFCVFLRSLQAAAMLNLLR